LRDAGKSNEIALNTKIGHEHSPAGNFVFLVLYKGKLIHFKASGL